MARPDRDDLVAALLAAQPKGYRERKPEQALQRAEQLAAGALSNWPAQPVRQRVLQPGITVVNRDDQDEVVLAQGLGYVTLEAAGLVVNAIHRPGTDGLGQLDVTIDPLGRDFIARLDVREFGHHESQAIVRVAGRRIAPPER